MKRIFYPLIYLIDKLSRKYLIDADKCMKETCEELDRELKLWD